MTNRFESEAELRARIAELDCRIARRKKFIHQLSNGRYVEPNQLPPLLLTLLGNRQHYRVAESLACRQSVLGAALQSDRRRPFSHATRSKNPDIKAAAQKLRSFSSERDILVEQLDNLLQEQSNCKPCS